MPPLSAAFEPARSYRPEMGAAKRAGEATALRKVSQSPRQTPAPSPSPCPALPLAPRPAGLTPAALCLQSLKPLMEKRRRARINDSLNQLKTLILPLIGKDVSQWRG